MVGVAWEAEILPLVRSVAQPAGRITTDESAGPALLARPAPPGDPDYVPTRLCL
jgi:hypothetical protein